MWLLFWQLVFASGISSFVFVSLLNIYQASETSLSFVYIACMNEFGQFLMNSGHFLVIDCLEELPLEEACRNFHVGPTKLNHFNTFLFPFLGRQNFFVLSLKVNLLAHFAATTRNCLTPRFKKKRE